MRRKEIKRAYHRLATVHPDKVEDSASSDPEYMEEIVRKFIEVVTAYEVLSDPVRRKRYDTLGDEAFHSANSASSRGGGGGLYKRRITSHFHMYLVLLEVLSEFHYTGSTAGKCQAFVRNVDVGLEELLAGSSGRAITLPTKVLFSLPR